MLIVLDRTGSAAARPGGYTSAPFHGRFGRFTYPTDVFAERRLLDHTKRNGSGNWISWYRPSCRSTKSSRQKGTSRSCRSRRWRSSWQLRPKRPRTTFRQCRLSGRGNVGVSRPAVRCSGETICPNAPNAHWFGDILQYPRTHIVIIDADLTPNLPMSIV